MTIIYKLLINYMADRGIGKTKGNTLAPPLNKCKYNNNNMQKEGLIAITNTII